MSMRIRAGLALVCGTAIVGGCDNIVEGRRAPEEFTFADRYTLVAQADGREPSPIRMQVRTETQELSDLLVFDYAWSPDGRSIAVAGYGGWPFCNSTRCAVRHLHVHDMVNDELRRLNAVEGTVYLVDWAPDGRLLVASAPSGAHADRDRRSLLRVDPSADVVVDTLPFEPRGFEQIRWSPDGSRFAAVEPSGNDDLLRLMAVDGSESEPLLRSSRGLRIDWSPDGDRLLAVEPRRPNTVYTYHLASGTRTDVDVALPSPFEFVSEARWSTDGRSILLTAGRTSGAPANFETNVFLMRAEGAALEDLGEGHSPEWRPRR